MNVLVLYQKSVIVFDALQIRVGLEECSRAHEIVVGAANFLQKATLHGVNSNTVPSAEKSDVPKIPALTEEFTKTEMTAVDLAGHLQTISTKDVIPEVDADRDFDSFLSLPSLREGSIGSRVKTRSMTPKRTTPTIINGSSASSSCLTSLYECRY